MENQAPPAEMPRWYDFVGPILGLMSDGVPRTVRDLRAAVIQSAKLTSDQLEETLPSGGSRAENRITWAVTHLSKAGWLERPARATYAISEAGRNWWNHNPQGVQSRAHANELFKHHWDTAAHTGAGANHVGPAAATGSAADESTPEELIASGVEQINDQVGQELLTRLRDGHPDFFEEVVVRVLLAMGYGGAEARGRRIGGSGDGGVDGLIDQDPLGLDRLYVQAKRYGEGNSVGREAIQAFTGALHGFGASKGIFITTSTFTKNAREYTDKVPTRIVLIDGQRLVGLMIKYRVGVQTKEVHEVVRIDEDFFE